MNWQLAYQYKKVFQKIKLSLKKTHKTKKTKLKMCWKKVASSGSQTTGH